jgi:CheY-like chemotaxis protein
MPGMDGYRIAQELRKQPWAKDTALIAVTGWGHEEDRVRSRRAGFDHHLVKPVDPTELVQLVSKARKAA